MKWADALRILAVLAGIIAFLALFIGPYLWLGAKIDAMSESFGRESKAFKKEMGLLKKPKAPKKTTKTKA